KTKGSAKLAPENKASDKTAGSPPMSSRPTREMRPANTDREAVSRPWAMPRLVPPGVVAVGSLMVGRNAS
ncbi:MAG: hypothetical protein MJE68_14085, partial [Proteobacteria bacterium]|nr:hypothetical protein [Pseudomonadota bacterium]